MVAAPSAASETFEDPDARTDSTAPGVPAALAAPADPAPPTPAVRPCPALPPRARLAPAPALAGHGSDRARPFPAPNP